MKQLRHVRIRTRVAATAIWCVLAATAVASGDLRTVAFSADPIPGTSAGTVFADFAFGNVALNNAGQTAFRGYMTGPDISTGNDEGLLLGTTVGDLEIIAREGDQAPGAPLGTTYRSLAFPVSLDDAGHAAYVAGLSGTNNRGLFRSTPAGDVQPIVLKGNQVPGQPTGVRYGVLSGPHALNGGQSAIFNTLTTLEDAIVSDRDMDEVIVKSGTQVPGMPSGATYGALSDPVMNGSGQIAFRARLFGTGVTGSRDEGLFSEGLGTELMLIARTGEEAPDTPPGTRYSTFTAYDLNAAGATAFRAELTIPGVVGNTQQAVLRQTVDGTVEMIARRDDPAPDAALGVVFNSFGPPLLDGQGQAVFSAGIEDSAGGVNSALFGETFGGALHLIVQSGDRAPETPEGVVFGNLGQYTVNARGQVAFSSFLTDPSMSGLSSAIYAQDGTGALHLIARSGGMLDVSDDPLAPDWRTVQTVSFSALTGSDSGKPSGLNDRGQVAFVARFTDGTSGVFVSGVAAVPEPKTSVLIGSMIGCGALARRSRLRRTRGALSKSARDRI